MSSCCPTNKTNKNNKPITQIPRIISPRISNNLTINLKTLIFSTHLITIILLPRRFKRAEKLPRDRHEAAMDADLDLQTEKSAERLLKASAGRTPVARGSLGFSACAKSMWNLYISHVCIYIYIIYNPCEYIYIYVYIYICHIDIPYIDPKLGCWEHLMQHWLMQVPSAARRTPGSAGTAWNRPSSGRAASRPSCGPLSRSSGSIRPVRRKGAAATGGAGWWGEKMVEKYQKYHVVN